jgi:hypothetical protein
MTRISAIAALVAVVIFAAAGVALAQNGTSSPSPGTNSAGTAQSSGPAPNREPGVTTGAAGAGSGHAAPDKTTSPDAAISAENDIIDRKLKGICRGC